MIDSSFVIRQALGKVKGSAMIFCCLLIPTTSLMWRCYMFIRRTQTRAKNSSEAYFSHRLVVAD
jgi:hypothetical protein